MTCKTVNIEAGRPDCETAMRRLSQELRIAKANRVRVLKVVHGYGSSGKGGAIKSAAKKMFSERKARGQIRDYVGGEDFTPFADAGRRIVSAVPELKKDIDYGRQNDGITIVLM